MGSDLLRTKLIIPPLRPNLLSRPHLMERLEQAITPGNKVCLISAPAGFGKTTLVTSWLHNSEHQTSWLSIDERDNDPARFLAYLIGAFQGINPDVGRAAREMLGAPQPPPWEAFLTALINDITSQVEPPRKFILVLDDYHLIDNQPVHDSIRFMLDNQPSQLHLVLITREDPPLPLSRLRGRQESIEIREADLRFSLSESTSLLNDVLGLNIARAQVETLEARTEGWITGLQLAALSLRGSLDADTFIRSFAGSNRYILDYLLEEVLNQQSPEVQEFLLHTAILDQMTAPLCDAVMADSPSSRRATLEDEKVPEFKFKSSRSQIMLERLDNANLFITPLDESREWFRYHNLFIELLRSRLRRGNLDVAELHRKAGGWFKRNGFLNRATDHFLAAEDWEQAADLVMEQSDALQKRGENISLLRWVEMLPEGVIRTRPDLCLDSAWALALSGDLDKAEDFLQIAEQAYRGQPALYGRVLTAQIHTARARHDLPRVVQLSQQALDFVPADDHDVRGALNLNLGIAHWQSGKTKEAKRVFTHAKQASHQAMNHHVELLATGFLGITLATQGKLRQAGGLLREALAWGAAYPASALVYVTLGGLAFEWNELEEAGMLTQKALAYSQQSGNIELQSSAYRLMAQLKQAQGEEGAALDALEHAVSVAGEQATPLTSARNAAAFVRTALMQGDLETARHWLDQMTVPASSSPFYILLHLAPACLCLALGDKASARSLLDAQYEKAYKVGWLYGQVEILLLKALAAPTTQDAVGFLCDSLTLAHPEGYLRTFLDKGENLVPLLHLAASKNVKPDYTRTILTYFEGIIPAAIQATPSRTPSSGLVEPLSERELEVLRLLSDGRTNREIAQAMVVSVNTIKSHLKNIFGKLGVHNRREALAHARLHHLILPDDS